MNCGVVNANITFLRENKEWRQVAQFDQFPPSLVCIMCWVIIIQMIEPNTELNLE